MNGYTPGEHKIDVHQIGYSSHHDGKDYKKTADDGKIHQYFYMLIASTAIISICIPLLAYIFYALFCKCTYCKPTLQERKPKEQQKDLEQQEANTNTKPADYDATLIEHNKKLGLIRGCLSGLIFLGLLALGFDLKHIGTELHKCNGNHEHHMLYMWWAGLLVAVLVGDIFGVLMVSMIINKHKSTNSGKDESTNGGKDESTNCKCCAVCIWGIVHVIAIFCSQSVIFHMCFIVLAFFSYPAGTFGILVAAASTGALLSFGFSFAAFTYFYNKCLCCFSTIFTIIFCVAYAIMLACLVQVTEFFDYTDDFSDSTVSNISTTILSIILTAVPPVLVWKQYENVCKIIAGNKNVCKIITETFGCKIASTPINEKSPLLRIRTA